MEWGYHAISSNVINLYFEAGDRIFLFGFSRGAATMRSLSSFIHYFGILPKSRPELIKRAYKIYKIFNEKKREKRERLSEEFVDRHHIYG